MRSSDQRIAALSDSFRICTMGGRDLSCGIRSIRFICQLGLAGQTLVPEVLQAIDTVRQACMRANIPCGRFCMTATQTRQEIDKRARPIVIVSDLALMAGVAKATMDSLNV